MGNQESVPTHVIKKKIVTKKPVQKPNFITKPEIIPSVSFKNNYKEEEELSYSTKKLDSTNKIIERNIMPDIYINKSQNRIIDYPISSNNQIDIPKNMDKIEFTPYNFNNEVSSYKNKLNSEREDFENSEKERRKMFENLEKNKKDYLQEQIKLFENKYNPWEILGLKMNDYNIANIKKAYKKNALKYHPDKAGSKYQDLFQLITQSYIYLLEKATDYNLVEEKINKSVDNIDYEDNINQKVENIYINKDNFNINQFNKIFDEYKIPNSFDKGYENLMKEDLQQEDNEIFGQKFNNDIFNSHFNTLKTKKKSNELVNYKDPDALDTSLTNLNQTFFGIDDIEDFGSVNTNGLCYTDYKKAHVDENLLIDANNVKYKTYNSIDQLESDRSKLSHSLSIEDKKRYEYLDRKKLEEDSYKLEKQKKYDQMIENQYSRMNQRLIIHK